MSAAMAHIHIGGPTENGNPVVILLPVYSILTVRTVCAVIAGTLMLEPLSAMH